MRRLGWDDLFVPTQWDARISLKRRQRSQRIGTVFLEYMQGHGRCVDVDAIEGWVRHRLVDHAWKTLEVELGILDRMLRSDAVVQWRLRHGGAKRAVQQIRAEVGCLRDTARGPLGDTIELFLRYRESLHRGMKSRETLLRFDDILRQHGVLRLEDIQTRHLASLLVARSRRSNALRLRDLSQYMRWLRRTGRLTSFPEAGLEAGGCSVWHRPHIYSLKELMTLLEGVRRVGGWCGLTAFTALHLIYACGLRISEALRLREEHVDLEKRLLRIEKTKFHKDRLIPIGRRAAEHLRVYLAARAGRNVACDRFFVSSRGAAVHPTWLRDIFRRTCIDAGLVKPGQWLRIHDLRHSFAVHRLYKWYAEGVEPQAKLILLSVYMGHVTVESTSHYLQMGEELMRLASAGCARTLDEILISSRQERR
jgi:integrase/recombinase XerD